MAVHILRMNDTIQLMDYSNDGFLEDQIFCSSPRVSSLVDQISMDLEEFIFVFQWDGEYAYDIEP